MDDCVRQGKFFFFAADKAYFHVLHITYIMKSSHVAEYVARLGEQHTTFGWENLKGK
jgi:hypothetical protein